MNNLDLRELRHKLNFTHESQGVSKSVAMKLMQELEEARARHRKAWGRAEKAEAAVARVRGLCTELRDTPVRPEAPDYVLHVLAGVSNAAADVLEALEGEQS